MTYAKFLTELKKTPREWVIHSNGRIRLSPHEIDACPISALNTPPESAALWEEVGEEISLAPRLARRIVDAADNCPRASKSIRRDLLKACGLPSEEPK